MKTQKRPFVVEIKQKRGTPKRPSSIWGDIDLAAMAADIVWDDAAARARGTETVDDTAVASSPAPVEIAPAQEEAMVGDETSEAGSVAELLESTAGDLPEERERVSGIPARSRRGRKALAPGQRWKRRLPNVLQDSGLRKGRRSATRLRGK